MINFEITQIRRLTKLSYPTADFDSKFTFYYDETNNIKKFYVRENDFNYTFTSNFVLGGLVHEGVAPSVQTLIDSFKLQKTTKEVKFKHIANGNFLECLNSEKLRLFLQFIKDSNFYVHYSSLNILYWAIVDIVDSAIVNSDIAQQLGPGFSNQLKNDLYKLARLEIDSVIKLFKRFEYPNVKKESIIQFVDGLTSLFDEYLDSTEFHIGLESLKQILKEAKKKGSLPFIMDEEDFILLKDLSQFYLRPIYTFKNSSHIFDNEDSISETLNNYRILDGESEIKNYSFTDSQTNQLIQLSDIFVGLWGKLTTYLNTNTRNKISIDLDSLSSHQLTNIDLLIDLEHISETKNAGFLHSIDSFEERHKMNLILEKRGKNYS
jgi:hypothetical protein